jgi:P-type Ca2+ transporter type 2C
VSSHLWVDGQTVRMDDSWRQRIEAANQKLAEEGMRVLGVAFRPLDKLPDSVDEASVERDLVFVGLTGMIDPARPEVKDAVSTAITAGIRPIMITGDHPLTAGYIARELGIAGPESQILTGADVQNMDEQALLEVVPNVQVFARVSPEHKLRIVQALQTQGEIAAMTGDGVNDAPALRKADIGVAMGITGTDVSKEASDMVLLDDNFATIVAAVSEGRVIYDNIRKFIKYTLSSNAGEIWVMLAAPFLGMPLPLLPLQILWINLVTDGLPGLALGVEHPERNTMNRPPYPPNENIFARGMARDILWVGAFMALISLGVGFAYWQADPQGIWRTMVFTTLTLSQMGFVLALRSNRESFFRIGPFSNRALIGAVLLTTLLQMAVVYVPFLQNIFDTQALPIRDLLVCFLLATSLFWAVEIQKFFLRRRPTRD